nr:DNA-3-methyladenine glycosylase [Candidatus Odyssella thessalonicensis]
MKLPYEFYNRHVVDVARELIGKRLVCGAVEGIITETEAYRGGDDAASHAARGKTERSAIMFGSPGHAYIYIIYGVYYCLNIVTEPAGQASAVLIRGLKSSNVYLNGPGKLCCHLGINKQYNGLDLVENDYMYLTSGIDIKDCLVTPRIGISKATDKLWRFVMTPADLQLC